MKNSNYTIKTINKGTAEHFLATNHYLSQQGNSVPSGVRYYGLIDEDKLIGVAIFSTMSSQNTAKGCFGLTDTNQQGFYEIRRLAVTDGSAAWFLSRCLAKFCADFDVKAIFGYVNPDFEDDAPYLENSFKAYGLTPKRSDFYEKLDDGSFLAHSRGKPEGAKGEWRPRPRKERLMRKYDESLTTTWKEG